MGDDVHERDGRKEPVQDKYAAPPPFRVASKIKITPAPLSENASPTELYNTPELKRVHKIRPIIAGGHSMLSPLENLKVAVEKLFQPMRTARWRDLFLHPQQYVKAGVTFSPAELKFIASCTHPPWILKNSSEAAAAVRKFNSQVLAQMSTQQRTKL